MQLRLTDDDEAPVSKSEEDVQERRLKAVPPPPPDRIPSLRAHAQAAPAVPLPPRFTSPQSGAWAVSPRVAPVRDELLRPFTHGRSLLGPGALGWLASLVLGALLYTRNAPVPATVVVPVSPADLSVSVNGQELASQQGLYKIGDLPPDRDHILTFERAGFVSETRRLSVHAGEVRVLPNVQLHSQLEEAAGKRTSAAPEHARTPPGKAVVEPAEPAQTQTHARATGVLRINSLPWAEVFIDGRKIGTTPQRRIVLPAGAHTVTLVNPELGMSRHLNVMIDAGVTSTRSVSLVE